MNSFSSVKDMIWSQDSSVSIAMGCGLDTWNLIPSREKRFFSTPQHPDWLWGTHHPYQWAVGTLSLGVRQVGCEADHSPPATSKVKNGGAIPPLPCTLSWRGAYLSTDNFTFTRDMIKVLHVLCAILQIMFSIVCAD
jgi:hypothetical protein